MSSIPSPNEPLPQNGGIYLKPSTADPNPWTRQRTVPMRVLILGQARTGCSSLSQTPQLIPEATRQALFNLGFEDVYHFSYPMRTHRRDAEMWVTALEAKFEGKGTVFGRSEFDRLLGFCDAISDHPCVSFSEELIDAYPEAKVVLTVRDSADVWYESAKATIGSEGHQLVGLSFLTRFWAAILPDDPPKKMIRLLDKYTGFGNLDDKEAAIAYYEGHIEMIKRAMKERGREKDLLVFNVKEGYRPFCEFLEVDGIIEPFPRVCERKVWLEDNKKLKEQWMREALVRTEKVIGLVGVVEVVAWGFLKWQSLRK